MGSRSEPTIISRNLSRMQELVARVSALGRRYAENPAVKLQVADLTLDLRITNYFRGSRRIELSARELTLLRVLMREPGRVFTRTELCERVWEREHEYDMKLVEVFISRLRRKIDVAAAYSYCPASRIHDPRNAMRKKWPLRWKLALYSRAARDRRHHCRRRHHLDCDALRGDRGL